MKSFKQMRIEGTIKRADAEQIQYHDLHVEDGFNALGRTEQDDADDESLYQYIVSGGRIPDLEVRPREDGGVWIVDGHRRHKQIGRAIANGEFVAKDGKYWIPVKQFSGNDVQRIARIKTSQANKKLSPLQLLDIYSRLAAFNLSHAEIATLVNEKEPHVKSILGLASANHDVQQMVKNNEVSATIAVSVVRKHGDGAGKVLAGHLETAKASGKKRVTNKIIHPAKRDTEKLYDELLEAVGAGIHGESKHETALRFIRDRVSENLEAA
jgi:ParB-like chromosome segregation protein Spo0J